MLERKFVVQGVDVYPRLSAEITVAAPTKGKCSCDVLLINTRLLSIAVEFETH